MSLIPLLGQLWSRHSPSNESAQRRRSRKASSKRGLMFDSLEDRRVMAITPIALSDFTDPLVLDFQAVPTGPIAANASAFQAIGISSITSTSDADVDSFSTASPSATRSLGATTTGLKVIDPNGSDRFGNNQTYTINFAQPQSRFGFTNDDSGGSNFDFDIVLFSGATQVDTARLLAPIFGRNALYFGSTIAFDRVVISNRWGDGFVIDDLTTEAPAAPTVTAPTFINVVEDQASALTGISFAAVGTGSVTASFSVPGGTLTATSGGNVTVSGSGTTALTLNGSIADINGFLSGNNLKFQTALNATASVTLTIGINDNGISGMPARTASTTTSLNVSGVNDDPIATLPFVSPVEDTPIDLTGFSISDIDSSGPFGVNIRVSDAAGVLTLRTDVAGGLTSGNLLNNGTSSLFITAASLAAINATLSATHGLVYTPANNFNGSALFAVDVLSDGDFGSDVGNVDSWFVSAVNDSPTNTVPGNLNIVTDVTTPISGTSITDIDDGGANVSVTLSALHGTLSVDSTVVGGLSAAHISGNDFATITITAPLSLINTTLAAPSGLQYRSDANYTGPDSLTVTTDDLGNFGSGGPQTAVNTVSILVAAANQAPTISPPASFSATQNLASPLNGLSFADVDAGSGSVTATFTVASGTLNATSGGNVTVSGSGSGTLSLSGAIADINTFISAGNLTFTEANLGAVSLSIEINDNGNSGLGGPMSVSVSTTINVATPPTVSIDDLTVNEGAGTATFTVRLSAASGQTITVNYATADDSAVDGEDYATKSGTLTFAPGATTATFTVSILDDSIDEPDQGFFINLNSPTNATIADGQGLGTITDNDAAPTVSVGDSTVTEGDNLSFIVSLSAPSQQVISVFAQTEPGTAARDDDFGWGNVTLTFNPGQTAIGVLVNTVDDVLDENTETMTLELTLPTNVTIVDASGEGTINDNDPTPTVSIDDVTVNEGAGTATFTISLSAASGRTATVSYATTNNSALSGLDYTAKSDAVTFAPGETTKTITIDILSDVIFEQTQTFFVNLSSPTNATIADGQGEGTIVDPFSTLSPGTAGIFPDPDFQGQRILAIRGSSRNDNIVVSPTSGGKIQVVFNGKGLGAFSASSFHSIAAYGQAGNDTIVVSSAITKPAQLFGNAGNDTLNGGSGKDTLWGGSDNDRLFGNNGGDELHGEVGDDALYGQAGDDSLFGEQGVDRIWGEAGKDTISGGDGNDSLYGGAENDLVRGDADKDLIYGDSGNDVLLGGTGTDNVLGGTGRDIVIGGDDKDTLQGDAGEDIVIGGSTNHDGSDAALIAILTEWAGAGSYAARITALKTAGGFNLVPGVDVFHDGDGDSLKGNGDKDWFHFLTSEGDSTDQVVSGGDTEIAN